MIVTNHPSIPARLGLVLLLTVGLAAAPAQSAPLRQDPTLGPIATFNDGSTLYPSMAALSATKFVVAYRDDSNANYGTAIVGDVGSDGTITYGSEYVFNTANTASISVAALSATQFVVAYQDGGNSNNGTVIVGDVSGTAITYGSEYVFNAASTNSVSVAALSATQFVVVYQDGGNSNNGTAIVGDVSGTAITYGSEYVFNTANTASISVAALSATQFVVAYQDGGNSNNGTAIVGDVSGTAITYGSEYVFNAASTNSVSVAALSATKFVVAYQDGGNLNYGTAIVGDVSGTAITYGTEYVFHVTDPTTAGAVAALSDSRFVVGYEIWYLAGPAHLGYVRVGVVTGNAIAYGTETDVNVGFQSSQVAVTGLDGNFVMGWADLNDSGRGKACVVSNVTPVLQIWLPWVSRYAAGRSGTQSNNMFGSSRK